LKLKNFELKNEESFGFELLTLPSAALFF